MPRTLAPYCLLLAFVVAPALVAQESADAQRITDRIRVLQREAERLAGEARTLVGDLRQREIEREIKAAQLKQAEAAMAEAERALQGTTTRLSDLEVQRINQLPDLKTQLVDIYKRGRSGYARMLFSAGDLREFARATRAVGALSAINERRIEEHRRTLEAMREERSAFEQKAKELQAKTAEARRAKSAADGAVASASELIRQIDSRRDLTAQYVGELQDAYSKVQQQVAALSTEKPAGRTRRCSAAPVPGGPRLARSRTHHRILRAGRRIGSAEGPRGTASRSPRTRTYLCGPSMAEPSVSPARSPGSARWSSSTTGATATRSTAISPRRPSSRGKPSKPVQRWAGLGSRRPGPRPCTLRCESTAVL